MLYSDSIEYIAFGLSLEQKQETSPLVFLCISDALTPVVNIFVQNL